MRTWEKNVRTVVPYTPGEQPKFVDVIKLNTNENPYPPSPKVKECLEKMNTEATQFAARNALFHNEQLSAKCLIRIQL